MAQATAGVGEQQQAAAGDAGSPFVWNSAAATSVGNVRTVNEDSYLDRPAAGMWVVADGMGGHDAGDTASRMIVETIAAVPAQPSASTTVDAVEDAILGVNETLVELAATANESRVCGSTVAALLAVGRVGVWLWAGDSRIYRLRGNELTQVTSDHSEVQELIDAGSLDAAEADAHPSANIITRAVGGSRDLCVEIDMCEIRDGDRFLLCTDGLHKQVPASQIAEFLRIASPRTAVAAMIDHVLAGAATDNVTVVVVHFHAAAAGRA